MGDHQAHGWAKVSTLDHHNTRWQPLAPLIVYCGRCRSILPADEDWVKLASEGDIESYGIMMAKVREYWGKSVTVTRVYVNRRGRMEIEFIQEVPPA